MNIATKEGYLKLLNNSTVTINFLLCEFHKVLGKSTARLSIQENVTVDTLKNLKDSNMQEAAAYAELDKILDQCGV